MKVVACSSLFLLALVTTGCGSMSSSSSQNGPTAQVRIMQASGDSGNVDVQVNGKTIASNLGWRQTFPAKTTTYANVQAGNIHYQEFAAGTSAPALVDTQLNVSANTYYTIVTAGEESTGTLGTFVLTDDHVAPAAGQLRLRFVNASSSAGPIDLYVAGASGFPSTPSVAGLAFKSATGYMSFSGTSVQLCASPTALAAGGLGGLPGVGSFCPMSIGLNFQTPPQNSLTFLFVDPATLPAGSGTGSFSPGMVLASLPF
jgi:Domain of unknown function (DUF4397)